MDLKIAFSSSERREEVARNGMIWWNLVSATKET